MKLIFALFISLLFFLTASTPIFADENFDIIAKTTYNVYENKPTKVIQNISILNKKEFIFTPSYTISFGFNDIKNIHVENSQGKIPFDYKSDNGVVTLIINFNNPPKGINSINNFTVNFETDEILEKKGDLFEIDVPGISEPDNFKEYESEIIVPDNFPSASIIKPYIPNKNNLVFSKNETKGAGIVLIFGEAQFYKLNLTYNISNPNLFPIVTEIALPPNTNYQNVLIEKISHEPNNVKIDNDGNWLAQYTLLPRERKVINISILVKVTTSPERINLSAAQIDTYTKENKYWEVNDDEIKKIAKELKTPEKIYDYVVDRLSYDYEKISAGNVRLGGRGALKKTNEAVCLEFADLFVTLARAAGIPARTVEGYAYTGNSRLRPLSLVEDVLHAWPEYYDGKKQQWVMVDPTWGNTTHGIDYFNSLDLDHVAFVIKGEDSTYPIPAGGYKFENSSKDINAEFISSSEFESKSSYIIDDSLPIFSFAGVPINGLISIKNTGNTAIINKKVIITNTKTGEEKEFFIKNLLPFGTENFTVSFNTSFLTNSDHDIKIQLDDYRKNSKVRVSFIPDLNLILIGGGIFVASILISTFAYKTGRIYIQRRKRKGSLHR